MNRWVLIFLLIAFGLWTAATAITQINPGEQGVVKRFGRILPDKPGPGLYVGFPWGIDRVERVALSRVRTVVLDFAPTNPEDENDFRSQMLTGDHNLVYVAAEVNYKVREEDVDSFVQMNDRIDGMVSRATETALAEWIAGRSVDEVLVMGKVELPRHLSRRVERLLADHHVGIQVEQSSVTKLQPPAAVKPAFDRLTEAETGIRTQTNQASQRAHQKENEAVAEIFDRQSQTKAYTHQQRVQAEAEATAFKKQLTIYQSIKTTDARALNVLWLDQITRLFAKMKDEKRIAPLDHTLGSDGLNLTEFLPIRKK